jgi:hypothetical protein
MPHQRCGRPAVGSLSRPPSNKDLDVWVSITETPSAIGYSAPHPGHARAFVLVSLCSGPRHRGHASRGSSRSKGMRRRSDPAPARQGGIGSCILTRLDLTSVPSLADSGGCRILRCPQELRREQIGNPLRSHRVETLISAECAAGGQGFTSHWCQLRRADEDPHGIHALGDTQSRGSRRDQIPGRRVRTRRISRRSSGAQAMASCKPRPLTRIAQATNSVALRA